MIPCEVIVRIGSEAEPMIEYSKRTTVPRPNGWDGDPTPADVQALTIAVVAMIDEARALVQAQGDLLAESVGD